VTEYREEDITGAAGVAQVIASLEEPVVLGIPGGHMMSVFDALAAYQGKVRTLLLREESLATVMAEALGRLTSQPAVVMGQGAWVLGNAGIGIMEAHLGSSPMVILVDATEGGSFSHHGPYQSGYGDYGAYDIVNGFRAITKRVFVALDPVQAIQMTQLAVKHAVTGEPGPVAVVFHSRALSESISSSDRPRLYLDRAYHSRSPLSPLASEVGQAAAVLRASKRPVLIAGNGIRLARADAALRAFAEQYGIPVATTAAGKGVFAETHPLALGVIGSFGNPTANAAVGDADLIVAVATKLGATDTANENPALIDAHRQKIIQIDAEPLNAGWTYPVDVQLVSDAVAGLDALAAEAGQQRGRAPATAGGPDPGRGSSAGQRHDLRCRGKPAVHAARLHRGGGRDSPAAERRRRYGIRDTGSHGRGFDRKPTGVRGVRRWRIRHDLARPHERNREPVAHDGCRIQQPCPRVGPSRPGEQAVRVKFRRL
jgi:acetolactate synthase I/II/III large subunit